MEDAVRSSPDSPTQIMPGTWTLVARQRVLFSGGPVSWSSRRQPCVSLSTTEAEFIAASETVKEAIWLKRLLTEIDNNEDKSIPILCDNDSTIKLVKNNQFHQRTKHIEIRHYFVREKQEAGKIEVSYVPKQDNLADIFKKAPSQLSVQRPES